MRRQMRDFQIYVVVVAVMENDMIHVLRDVLTKDYEIFNMTDN